MQSRLSPARAVLPCLLAAAWCFGPLLHAGEDAAEKCFLWKATSNGNTVYLLGSIHVGNKDFYPMAKEIDDAFAQAKHLAVEIDPDKDQAKLAAQMQAKMQYEGEDTLATKLSADALAKVKKYCEDNHLPFDALKKVRPWALAIQVTMLETQRAGLDPALGIDRHFLDRARKDEGKTIKELESAEFQLDLLAGFPDDLQEKFLIQTLEETANIKKDLGDTVAAWKRGDPDGVEALLTKVLKKHPELKPVMAKLNDDRNVEMVKKVEEYLKSGEVHFVVVGSLHLVGEKGVVHLLKDKGYAVEQVVRSAKPEPEPAGAK